MKPFESENISVNQRMIAAISEPLQQAAAMAKLPQNPPKLRQPSVKELAEIKKQLQESPWDNSLISTDLFNSVTAADLSCGAILIFFGNLTMSICNSVNQICLWMGVPRNFTIYLFYIDAPLRFITADEWPEKQHVNGGWNASGTNTVVIYRREEWERVLIHEIIHSMGWDWTDMPIKPLSCWNLSDNSTVSPHLFEAWTELLAEFLYCIWFNIPWYKQLTWMRKQALQILARYLHIGKWSENTSIFAYYILKTALSKYVAELFVFGKPASNTEYILCDLISDELTALYSEAANIVPIDISMRMSVPN